MGKYNADLYALIGIRVFGLATPIWQQVPNCILGVLEGALGNMLPHLVFLLVKLIFYPIFLFFSQSGEEYHMCRPGPLL